MAWPARLPGPAPRPGLAGAARSPRQGDALPVTAAHDGHDDDATRSPGAVAEQELPRLAGTRGSARRAGVRRRVRLPAACRLPAGPDLHAPSQRARLPRRAAVVADPGRDGGRPAG